MYPTMLEPPLCLTGKNQLNKNVERSLTNGGGPKQKMKSSSTELGEAKAKGRET